MDFKYFDSINDIVSFYRLEESVPNTRAVKQPSPNKVGTSAYLEETLYMQKENISLFWFWKTRNIKAKVKAANQRPVRL